MRSYTLYSQCLVCDKKWTTRTPWVWLTEALDDQRHKRHQARHHITK